MGGERKILHTYLAIIKTIYFIKKGIILSLHFTIGIGNLFELEKDDQWVDFVKEEDTDENNTEEVINLII